MASKYLSGEMNEQEKKDYMAWVAESEDNTEFFKSTTSDWEITENYHIVEENEIEKAWGDLTNKFEKAGLLPGIKKARTINLYSFTRIAAVILLFIGIGYLGFKSYTEFYPTEFVILSDNSVELTKDTLPDGSVITLKRNTKLVYNSKFNSKDRKVEISGEAFFDITHNKNKPFIIKAGTSEIKVLGTSFNVNTRIPNKEVEVIVSTGIVELSSENKRKVLLKAGNIGTILNNTLIVNTLDSENNKSKGINKIVFDTTPLHEVVGIIQNNYDVEIDFSNNNLKYYKLNSTFVEQPIDSLIQTICTTFSLRYTKDNNRYTLFSN